MSNLEPPPQVQQPPQYAAAPQYAAQPQLAARAAKLNVPGIVALAVLSLSSLMTLFAPLLVRIGLENDSLALTTTIAWVVNGSTLVIAGALAIIGLMSKTMTRARWTAIGAAVSVGFGLLSLVFSMLSGLLAASY